VRHDQRVQLTPGRFAAHQAGLACVVADRGMAGQIVVGVPSKLVNRKPSKPSL
jgi:hypothetical protein